MVRIINLIVLWFFLSPICLHAEALADLEEFDLRTYRVENHGLKDLIFDIRSPEMFNELTSNLSLGKLIDVYVRVYWTSPGRYKLSVEGLPKGFSDIEDSIKLSVKPFLEFVMPEKVAPKFRSYKLSSKIISKNTIITGNDETGNKPVLKIEATLDSKLRLQRIATESIQGRAQIDFDYTVKSWSANKWVVDKAVTVNGNESAKTVTTQTISYDHVSGFGFPQKIVLNTKEFLGGKQSGQERRRIYNFSGYEVNTGKAQHMITK